MMAVREVKKEAGSDLTAAKALNKEIAEQMFSKLTKGQNTRKPNITPAMVADSVTGMVAGVDGVNQEALDNFNQALRDLMQTMVVPNEPGDK